MGTHRMTKTKNADAGLVCRCRVVPGLQQLAPHRSRARWSSPQAQPRSRSPRKSALPKTIGATCTQSRPPS